jgi:hypothetical protein
MSRDRILAGIALGALAAVAPASPLRAQTTITIPPIDFSGTLFANYQYRTDSRAKDFNKFDVERVYLTFRMPVGDRASVRVTTDVFQQQNTPNDAYYAGWTLRLKFAYLQYNFITGSPTSFAAAARFGIIQTVILDQEEPFWPRWISQADVERAGLLLVTDTGVSTLFTLPDKLGEICAAITNGPGFTSREMDRFKDPQARITITPFGNSHSPLLATWMITPWYYKGTVASRFVASAPPPLTNGPVGSGLRRDRYGIFSAIRDTRLTLGAQVAGFMGQSETGANTQASPRVVVDSSGRVLSGFGIVKPLALLDTARTRFGVLARYDKITTNTTTDAKYHVFIGGLLFDLTRRATIALDYQEQLSDTAPTVAGVQTIPTPPLKTYFVHVVANF